MGVEYCVQQQQNCLTAANEADGWQSWCLGVLWLVDGGKKVWSWLFESLFLVLLHLRGLPSVYCQRPGSACVQMVPSCIWESPVAPEPRSLPPLSPLISSTLSPRSHLSFKPSFLFSFQVLLLFFERRFHQILSFLPLTLTLPLRRVALVLPICTHPLCFPLLHLCHPSSSSFFVLSFSQRSSVKEAKSRRCQRGIVFQPLLMTLGSCDQPSCLQRHQ